MRCACWGAFLFTTVVKSDYRSYFLAPQTSGHFLAKLRTCVCVCENPMSSTVCEIFKPVRLAPTTMSRLELEITPLHSDVSINWRSWRAPAWLYALLPHKLALLISPHTGSDNGMRKKRKKEKNRRKVMKEKKHGATGSRKTHEDWGTEDRKGTMAQLCHLYKVVSVCKSPTPQRHFLFFCFVGLMNRTGGNVTWLLHVFPKCNSNRGGEWSCEV